MPGSLLPIELNGIRWDQNQELDATCLIWRVTDEGTFSKVTADYISPATTTIFNGACFIAPIVSRRDRFDVHGEQQVYQNQYRVLIPWDAGSIAIGDFITITVSNDPEFLGREMTVKDVLYVSDLSLRRLTAIDIDE